MRHSLKRFNNVFEQVEESEIEDWPMEIIQAEEQKEKIRVPWDTIKHTNICIIGIPEKEKRKGQKKYISKNNAKNFQVS